MGLRQATPPAALSGYQAKAPGFAGGYLLKSEGCNQAKVSEAHSGRICRADRPSGNKTMGGRGENDHPRRKSL